jgi:hypothetical protein
MIVHVSVFFLININIEYCPFDLLPSNVLTVTPVSPLTVTTPAPDCSIVIDVPIGNATDVFVGIVIVIGLPLVAVIYFDPSVSISVYVIVATDTIGDKTFPIKLLTNVVQAAVADKFEPIINEFAKLQVLLHIPPRIPDWQPDAVLHAPPLIVEDVPDAVLELPPPTVEYVVDAVFKVPPPTVDN